jgi:hypothetical protein
MARESDLVFFVAKVPSGKFHLMTDDGTVILEAESWRALRGQLDHLFESHSSRPAKFTLCVGHPRPVPRPSPSQPRLAAVQAEQIAP